MGINLVTGIEEGFFNLFGVLNFKIRKSNKKMIKEAFWFINNYSNSSNKKELLMGIANALKKKFIKQDIKNLAIIINRRNYLKKVFIFKISENSIKMLKKCWECLKQISYEQSKTAKAHNGVGK